MATPAEPFPWRVIIDANVFFAPPVRDLLLECGVRADPFLTILWSDAILDEVARNWARVTGPRDAAARWRRLEDRFRAVFAAGRITATATLGPGSRVALEDRHVAESALAGRADGIVTFNLRDFPAGDLAAVGLRLWHPDALLCALFARDAARLLETLEAQGAALNIPRALPSAVAVLARTCPRFAALARILLGNDD